MAVKWRRLFDLARALSAGARRAREEVDMLGAVECFDTGAVVCDDGATWCYDLEEDVYADDVTLGYDVDYEACCAHVGFMGRAALNADGDYVYRVSPRKDIMTVYVADEGRLVTVYAGFTRKGMNVSLVYLGFRITDGAVRPMACTGAFWCAALEPGPGPDDDVDPKRIAAAVGGRAELFTPEEIEARMEEALDMLRRLPGLCAPYVARGRRILVWMRAGP